MDNLWAPWRIEYILKSSGTRNRKCFLCAALKDRKDSNNHIIHRSKFAFAIMNKYPYSPGHIMVAPTRHTADIADLDGDEILDTFMMVKKSMAALKTSMKPHGYNVGMNLGRVAGAGLETHLHIHIVPRWNGDVNFMSVLSKTRIISEGLESSYRKIRKAFK